MEKPTKPAEKLLDKYNYGQFEIPMVPAHRHRSIISEHEQILDGIRFRERKEMVKFPNNPKNPVSGQRADCIKELVHSRYIGNEKYLQVTQTWKNGELEDTEITSNLENDQAMEDFKKQWTNGWYPALIHMTNMNLQQDLPKKS